VSSTADKALELLNLFSQSRPELGLSDLSRLSGLDKATAHRMLGVLAKHGFVEQGTSTKLYRLGAGSLRLARIREASFPVSALVEPALQLLADRTGETCHASLIAGGNLATIGLVAGKKTIHVTLDAGERLPFHATASGFACLAFLPEEQVQVILKRKLASYTAQTATSPDDVRKAVRRARGLGYAVADQSFEQDVFGIAAPLFEAGGKACGAVAVATPAHRMTRDIKTLTIQFVLEAAIGITRSMGVEPPAEFLSLTQRAAA
jgi:IclR family transcriptional regulator, acetate operon repressor